MGRYDKLVLIDDEEEIGGTLKALFSEMFKEVTFYEDSQKALEEITKNEPSLIISDINMPGMSGDALVRQVRSRGILIPIVFLSGYVTREVYAMALRLGVSDIFEKPYDFDYMQKAIEKILELEKRKSILYIHMADPNYPKDKIEKEKKLLGLLHVVHESKL